MPHFVQVMLFVVSSVLLVGSSAITAFRISTNPSDRFWIGLAAASLQLGTLFVALSLFSALSPLGFLGLQFALTVIVLCILGMPRRTEVALRASGLLRRQPLNAALLIVILLLIANSALQQFMMPINGWDERGYHASRVLYWLQHGSIAPFETHNLRQTTFPFLAELFFAWPLLFVKSEALARMVFWLAFPTGIAGVYFVARELRIGRSRSLIASLIYASTPTVLLHAASLKTDIWQPVMILGAAYFALRSFRKPAHGGAACWFGSGIFLALAISIKTTSLALLPGLLACAVFRGGRPHHSARRMLALGFGFMIALGPSGFGPLMYWNMRDHGHPLGDRSFTRIHTPQFSAMQIGVHAARTPLFLLELPEVPSEHLRQAIERRVRSVSILLGAERELQYEAPSGWPGLFQYSLASTAHRYSLGGALLLPLVLVAAIRFARERSRRRSSLRSSRVVVLTAVMLPLLLGLVFMVRWMGGGPDRFWLAPYALAIPMIIYFFSIWTRRHAMVAGLALLLLVWTIYPAVRQSVHRTDWIASKPFPMAHLNEPFHTPLQKIPDGSVILLVAGQGIRDYPLFVPHRGYPNRVASWGQGHFDEDRLQRLLATHDITHVLLEGDAHIGFHAHGVATRPLVRWLKDSPQFEEIPLDLDGPGVVSPGTGTMRLFGPSGATPDPVRADRAATLAANGLLKTARPLSNKNLQIRRTHPPINK